MKNLFTIAIILATTTTPTQAITGTAFNPPQQEVPTQSTSGTSR